MTKTNTIPEYHDTTVVDMLTKLGTAIHAVNVGNGFYEDPPSFAEQVALMHSELSEALEGDRHGDPPDDKVPEFTAREAELADTLIRILDAAEFHQLRVAEATLAKLRVNAGRGYKHGGKAY